MKKTIDFSKKQVEFIEKNCKEKEISFTEMVKRIIDDLMEKTKNPIIEDSFKNHA